MVQPNGVNNPTTDGTAIQRPTILLVTGAWHIPEHYAPLIDALRALGLQVSCPRLPSSSGHLPPPDLDDDIMFIRSHAKELIDRGEDLLVLMHSYGGMVGSYAFVDFPTPATKANKTGGRLLGMMYMSAFVPLAGEALNDILALVFGVKAYPPFVEVDNGRNVAILRPDAAAKFFYQDCTEEQLQRASALFMEQSLGCQDDAPKRQDVMKELGLASAEAVSGLRMSYTLEGVHMAYLYCDLDAGLTPPIQEMMVSRVKKMGFRVHQWHIEAGHSPFINKPAETAAAVQEMVSRLV